MDRREPDKQFSAGCFFDGHDKAGRVFERYDGGVWRSISYADFVQQHYANMEGSVRWQVLYTDSGEAAADYMKWIKKPAYTERDYKDYPHEKIRFEQFTLGQWQEISEEHYKAISA